MRAIKYPKINESNSLTDRHEYSMNWAKSLVVDNCVQLEYLINFTSVSNEKLKDIIWPLVQGISDGFNIAKCTKGVESCERFHQQLKSAIPKDEQITLFLQKTMKLALEIFDEAGAPS